MAQWKVEYQGPDKKPRSTVVNAPDNLTKATEVASAIENGEVDELYIAPGAILTVQKYRPPSIA